jgi:hypothetical protein
MKFQGSIEEPFEPQLIRYVTHHLNQGEHVVPQNSNEVALLEHTIPAGVFDPSHQIKINLVYGLYGATLNGVGRYGLHVH